MWANFPGSPGFVYKRNKKMKKATLLAALVLAGMTFTGCMSSINVNNGIASCPPGSLFSEMKAATLVQDRAEGRSYTVVKKVSAQATTTNFLGLVSQGDASYATLKAQALRGTGADDIIDLEIDYTHNNILGIVNKVTTVINGTAVKYTK